MRTYLSISIEEQGVQTPSSDRRDSPKVEGMWSGYLFKTIRSQSKRSVIPAPPDKGPGRSVGQRAFPGVANGDDLQLPRASCEGERASVVSPGPFAFAGIYSLLRRTPL